MIKLQESLTFCLNPICPQQYMRSFDSMQPHSHSKCTKWLISQERLNSPSYPYSEKELKEIKVDFENSPAESFRVLEKIKKSHWQQLVEKQQNQTKKELIRVIECQFQALRDRIYKMTSASQILDTVRSKIHEPYSLSQNINEYYEKSIKRIEEIGKQQIFSRNNNQDRIRRVKQQVGVAFDTDSCSSKVNSILTVTELANFKNFIYEDQDSYFNRLQRLNQKLNQDHPRYHVENQKIRLDCPLCHYHSTKDIRPINLKAIKKDVARDVLVHIYEEHQEEAGYVYTHQLQQDHLQTLIFEEVIKQSAGYKEVLIVDRESGAGGKYTYNQARKHSSRFIIEVMTTKNEAMKRTKHLLVEVGESVDLMIAIISYICTQRNQDVQLLTNRPALRKGIHNMMYCKASEL